MRRSRTIRRFPVRRSTPHERVRPAAGSLRLCALLALGCAPEPDGGHAFETQAPLERLASGFVFTEGPLWDAAQQRLLFSELEHPFTGCGGRLLAWRPSDGVTALRAPSCNANGLAFDRDGSLLCAEHGSRSVTRLGASYEVVGTLAASFAGVPLNAPNDLAVRSDGTLYFSDPDFVGPAAPRRGTNAVFRIPAQGGEPLLEARMDGPNGLALAPDERTLFVSDMRLGRVLAFAVAPEGALGPPRVFATGTPLADGLALDAEGSLFVATAAGERGAIAVFAPDGRPRGSIAIPEPARSCAFGGEDLRTLFVTAGGSLHAVRLAVPGRMLARAPDEVQPAPLGETR